MLIQFSPFRLHELGDLGRFRQHAEAWLVQREAENNFILELIAGEAIQGAAESRARYFTLQDGATVIAALVLISGVVHMTWASVEMLPTVADGLANAGCDVSAVHGPGHVATSLAGLLAAHSGGNVEVAHSTRVYQLARVIHTPSPEGQLKRAGDTDLPIVLDWFNTLCHETTFAAGDRAALARQLVASGNIYLWHQPGPCAMAAFVHSTPNGASIRHVYVPAPFRRQGFAKNVIAALAKKIFAEGRRFVFLQSEPADLQTDSLLQQVGARTICEYALCRIHLKSGPRP